MVEETRKEVKRAIYPLIVSNRREAAQKIAEVGADPAGTALMSYKAVFRTIKITNLKPHQANIIKQEMLARGGEAAVNRGVVNHSVATSDALLLGTVKQFQLLIRKLKSQPFGLVAVAAELEQLLQHMEGYEPYQLDCRGHTLEMGRHTLVMGILNITPDSFSDGGRYLDPDAAVERARQMEAEGADLIDVGAESTRPGHTPVPLEEELRRLIPVLKKLVKSVNIPISVDTYKAEVARQALELGVHLVNDQWALRADPDMAAVVARYQAPVILMHNQRHTEYRDLIGDMYVYFQESIARALAAGLPRQKIIIDPGIGFGKTVDQNLEVLRRLGELRGLGLPILVGTSRKSVIGKTLDLPVDQRLEGTAATVAVSIVNGADIVRVHDVKEMVRVARMTDAIVRPPGGTRERE